MDILFEELYRYERTDEHAYVSIPMRKGELKDPGDIVVMDEDKQLLTQSRALAFWEDGSVKWLFVRFMVTLPALKEKKLRLEIKKHENTEASCKILIHRENGKICADNGALKCTLSAGKSLIEALDYKNQHYTAADFAGPVLKDGMYTYDTQFGEWHCDEAGPLVCSFSSQGSNKANGKNYEFEVKLTMYYKKPWIEIEYRLINTDREPLTIGSLGMDIMMAGKDFDPEKSRVCIGSSNYKTDFCARNDGGAVMKLINSEYILQEAAEHMAEVMHGTFFADVSSPKRSLAVTMYQAVQNYPKALMASPEKISIFIVPECSEKVVMQPGMAKTTNFLLHFHDNDETLTEIDNRSLIYQMPDTPSPDVSIFEDSEATLDIYVKNQSPRVELSLMMKADNHARAYGMMNFGDTPDPGYTRQGRGCGKLVWTNNEYDFPHAAALMYMRTGVRRYKDYAAAAARHWMDVDVCHYSEDESKIGGQWEHTAGHCINGAMVCSHEWVEGLLDYYHLYGDERALKTALGIGENVLRLLELPMFNNSGEVNARETGWALRTLTALYTETYDSKWLKKCDWIAGHFKEWEEKYGHWLAPYTDNTLIRVPFMISVAVGSLMRYYRIKPDEQLKEMIVRAVDDMIEKCELPSGAFYYKGLPSLGYVSFNVLILEALAAAYELTENREYLNHGFTLFELSLDCQRIDTTSKTRTEDTVLKGAGGSKNFAQSFIPLMMYYKGISKEYPEMLKPHFSF